MLTPCRSNPNCVSSLNHEKRFHVKPWRYDYLDAAKKKLLYILESDKRTRIVASHGHYIRAEFRSFLFRFIDDVEFYFDEDQKLVQLKSASRIGYFDLGTNRRRIERLGKIFQQGGQNGIK